MIAAGVGSFVSSYQFGLVAAAVVSIAGALMIAFMAPATSVKPHHQMTPRR